MIVFLRRLGFIVLVLSLFTGGTWYLSAPEPGVRKSPEPRVSASEPSDTTNAPLEFTGGNGEGRSLPDETIRHLESLGFQPVNRGDTPPAVSLPGMADETHSLSDYRGKLVLLNLWASWCPPCREEMPSMQRLWERFQGDRFVIIGINLKERRPTVQDFINEYELDFPIWLDRSGDVARKFRVSTIPTTWLMGPRGRPLARLRGPLEWDKPEVIRLVEELLDVTGVEESENNSAG